MTPIFRRFARVVNGFSLKRKLLIICVLLIVLPLGFFSFFSFDRFSAILQDQILFSARKNFDQTQAYCSEKINKIVGLSKIVVTNETVLSLFEVESVNLDIVSKSRIVYELSRFVSSIKGDDVYDFYVYLPEGSPFRTLSPTFMDMSTVKEKNWFPDFSSSLSSSLFCPYEYFDPIDTGQSDPLRVLSVIRYVKSAENLLADLGVVRIDFREDSVSKVVDLAASVDGSVAYIQNARGIPVVASDWELCARYLIPVSYATAPPAENSVATMQIDGRRVFFFIEAIPQTDWFLTTVIPYDGIFAQVDRMQREMLLLIVAIIGLAFLLASYLTYSLTRRIYALSRRMHDVQTGDLGLTADTLDGDEIGQLTRDFNRMLVTISELMEERYKAGVAIKNAELKLLQAQINPHFLYNTLDMINWLAQMNRTAEVEQAVNALSSFYKLGLSHGREEIVIRDEIEHIRAYVQLQNMRYQNRINLRIDMEPGLEDHLIMKLTLQPIVENAILHGIMKKPSRSGTISIEGKLIDGTVSLRIRDDGIGMKKDQIDGLLSSKPDDKGSHGYGILNISERMKLFYGEEYGLAFQSDGKEETQVALRFPARLPLPGTALDSARY